MTESAKTPSLAANQKRQLRQLAHHLSPVVMVGDKGLHPGVYRELEDALENHELIKLRISGAERDEKARMIKQLAKKSGSQLVQLIGHIAVLYRPAKEPVIRLPKAASDD